MYSLELGVDVGLVGLPTGAGLPGSVVTHELLVPDFAALAVGQGLGFKSGRPSQPPREPACCRLSLPLA
jgi:hypothetical protein